ncbi:MAG: zf-HC2 domain-containing protein [Deltaproteobacteria bacterium]|nr:zf-HC2 domain-containing protein [Deltaproteobacteria bacterium]
MNCAQAKEQLLDFLYDELSPAARAAFVEHLRGCPGCNAEVASHRRAIGQARAALTGPLLQEPPARLRLAVMEAAKAQASSARKAATADKPGFLARLWRTPWLLPAFGAASVATAIFLVRVLKNPEVLPGQKPRPIDEVTLAPPPSAPRPAAAPAAARPAEPELAEERPAMVESAPARARGSAAKTPGSAEAIAKKARRGVRSAPLPGLDLEELGSGANVPGRFAQPPPPRPAGGKSLDDLLSDVGSRRKAAAPTQPERQAPGKPAVKRDDSPPSWDEFPAGERKEKISKPTSRHDPFEDAYATPPPAAPSPSAMPAPGAPPAPGARPKPPSYAPAEGAASAPAPAREPPAAAQPVRAPRAQAAGAAKLEASEEMDLDDLAKDKVGKGAGADGPSLAESVKKAERLFASADWDAAAAAYRELLRRFPGHKDAPKWRERMHLSLVAVEKARTAKDTKAGKAAKAKSSVEGLNGKE